MIDTREQETLRKGRTQSEMQRLIWINRCLMVVILVLAVLAFSFDRRYASLIDRHLNEVRVGWVKLFPSGETQFEYLDDGGNRDRYFDRAAESSLYRYVKSRFALIKATISYDYAVAFTYLSPQERDQFLTDFNAAERAATFAECPNCAEVEVEIRGIEHDQLTDPTDKSSAVYRATVYITEIERAANGVAVSQKPKVVILRWRLRPIEALSKDVDSLRANPLGIEILDQSVRDEVVTDPLAPTVEEASQ